MEDRIRKWVAHAPTIRTPDGREWLILDQGPPMMFLEGSATADWVIDRALD